MMRVLAGTALLILATLVPLPVLFVLAVAYALRWPAYELIVLGTAIDAYYGIADLWPYYTIVAVALVLGCEWLKPRLLFVSCVVLSAHTTFTMFW